MTKSSHAKFAAEGFAPFPPAFKDTASRLKEHSINAAQHRSGTGKAQFSFVGWLLGGRERNVKIMRTVSVMERALTGHD